MIERTIVSLDTSKNQPRTSDEWRALAKSQHDAGNACEYSAEALSWHQQSILSLSQVLDFTPDDWRKLASYQNHAGVASDKLEWYEKAIASISKIDEFTPNDWRELAKYQNNSGNTCDGNPEKLVWFNKAIASINQVSDFSFEDWRTLAYSQYYLSTIIADRPEAFNWIRKAIISIKNIKKFAQDDWRTLADYQMYAAMKSIDIVEKRAWLEKSIDSRDYVRPHTDADWHVLAVCQNDIGVDLKGQSGALEWIDAAISSLRQISKLTPEIWITLIHCQYNAGIILKSSSTFKKAEAYFLEALDSCCYVVNEIKIMPVIKGVFSQLAALSLPLALECQFYLFAKVIFTENDPPLAIKNTLDNFSQTILDSGSRILPRVFLQLLKLMQVNSGFLHQTIQEWISANATLFKSALQEMTALHQPALLLEETEHSSNFNEAIARRLLLQDEAIRSLSKQIETLKEAISTRKKPASPSTESRAISYADSRDTLFKDGQACETLEELSPHSSGIQARLQ